MSYRIGKLLGTAVAALLLVTGCSSDFPMDTDGGENHGVVPPLTDTAKKKFLDSLQTWEQANIPEGQFPQMWEILGAAVWKDKSQFDDSKKDCREGWHYLKRVKNCVPPPDNYLK